MVEAIDQHIILFDGVCNLCNGAVKFIITRDPKGKFKFAPLQSDFGQAMLAQYHLSQQDFDSFVYIDSGIVYQKSAAALHVLKDLKGLWHALYVFIIVPRFIRDWVYDRVAASRYQIFGKTDYCMVPTPEVKERFL